MFLDTHCHLSTIKEKDIQLDALLENLAKEDFWFILDIGTHCDDLDFRQENVKNAIINIKDKNIAEKAKNNKQL